MKQQPEARKAFPKGDLPVLVPGEAFSKSFDLKRRGVFVDVYRESFSKVFAQKGLFELVPLPEAKDPKGNWIFQVDSRIVRTPTFFTLSRTRGEMGHEERRLVGLLFGIEVDWSFSLVDPGGRVLYHHQTRSEPARALHFRVQPSDPEWAPYSIMMDSAYWNYARQTVARFGVQPPPEKDQFEFAP